MKTVSFIFKAHAEGTCNHFAAYYESPVPWPLYALCGGKVWNIGVVHGTGRDPVYGGWKLGTGTPYVFPKNPADPTEIQFLKSVSYDEVKQYYPESWITAEEWKISAKVNGYVLCALFGVEIVGDHHGVANVADIAVRGNRMDFVGKDYFLQIYSVPEVITSTSSSKDYKARVEVFASVGNDTVKIFDKTLTIKNTVPSATIPKSDPMYSNLLHLVCKHGGLAWVKFTVRVHVPTFLYNVNLKSPYCSKFDVVGNDWVEKSFKFKVVAKCQSQTPSTHKTVNFSVTSIKQVASSDNQVAIKIEAESDRPWPVMVLSGDVVCCIGVANGKFTKVWWVRRGEVCIFPKHPEEHVIPTYVGSCKYYKYVARYYTKSWVSKSSWTIRG